MGKKSCLNDVSVYAEKCNGLVSTLTSEFVLLIEKDINDRIKNALLLNGFNIEKFSQKEIESRVLVKDMYDVRTVFLDGKHICSFKFPIEVKQVIKPTDSEKFNLWFDYYFEIH
jgi:hypothetical protein